MIIDKAAIKGIRYEDVFQLTWDAIKELNERVIETERRLYVIEQFNERLEKHPTLKAAYENYKNAYEEFLVLDKLVGKDE